MKILTLLTLFALVSCGSLSTGKPQEGKVSYSYNDVSGRFDLVREHKLIKKKLLSRVQIVSSASGVSKVLEKSIVVSQLGSVKLNKKRLMVLRPSASEFTVWLEGKKYFSKTKLNTKTKSLDVQFESPETGLKQESKRFPNSKNFCYYSQIPECLYHNSLLPQALDTDKKLEFYIVWESYPFTQDQFSHVGKNLFSKASIRFERTEKKLLRFIVEVEGQMILYHFSKSFDLVKVSWIAQGITVLPAGEELTSLDEE